MATQPALRLTDRSTFAPPRSPSFAPPAPSGRLRPVQRVRLATPPGKSLPPPIPLDARRPKSAAAVAADPPKTEVCPPPVATIEHIRASSTLPAPSVTADRGLPAPPPMHRPSMRTSWDEPTWIESHPWLMNARVRLKLIMIRRGAQLRRIGAQVKPLLARAALGILAATAFVVSLSGQAFRAIVRFARGPLARALGTACVWTFGQERRAAAARVMRAASQRTRAGLAFILRTAADRLSSRLPS